MKTLLITGLVHAELDGPLFRYVVTSRRLTGPKHIELLVPRPLAIDGIKSTYVALAEAGDDAGVRQLEEIQMEAIRLRAHG